MKTGITLTCLSLLLGLLVLAMLAGPAAAEKKNSDDTDNTDENGAVQIQTDVAGEDDQADEADDKKSKKDKAGKKDKSEKSEKELKKSEKPDEEDEDDEIMEEEDEINPELTGDFAQMARVGKLDKKQQDQLLQAQEAMELALQNWDDKWDDKICKVEDVLAEISNKRKRAKIEKQLKRIKRDRQKLSAREFAKALKLLKPKQMVAWNSCKLWEEAEREFAGLELTDTQVEKIKAGCERIAKKVKGSKDISSNKKLQKLIVSQAFRLLSKRQKREYRKIKLEQKRAEIEAKKQNKNKKCKAR